MFFSNLFAAQGIYDSAGNVIVIKPSAFFKANKINISVLKLKLWTPYFPGEEFNTKMTKILHGILTLYMWLEQGDLFRIYYIYIEFTIQSHSTSFYLSWKVNHNIKLIIVGKFINDS